MLEIPADENFLWPCIVLREQDITSGKRICIFPDISANFHHFPWIMKYLECP